MVEDSFSKSAGRVLHLPTDNLHVMQDIDLKFYGFVGGSHSFRRHGIYSGICSNADKMVFSSSFWISTKALASWKLSDSIKLSNFIAHNSMLASAWKRSAGYRLRKKFWTQTFEIWLKTLYWSLPNCVFRSNHGHFCWYASKFLRNSPERCTTWS